MFLPSLDPATIVFGNAKTVTKAIPPPIIFTAGDVGKTVYYQCCYESTRSERSVWSTVVSGVIG